MKKCVLFDLDGTLLSTLDSILYHLNRTLSNHGLVEITLAECAEFIGNGAKKLVTRAVRKSGVTDEDVVQSVLTKYNHAYNSDPLPLTVPYDGICELVDKLYLDGVLLGVITNKPEPTAKQLVEHFFPGMFLVVKGGRIGAVLKPDPKESLDALSLMGVESSECVFVGDTSVDIETGKNIGAAMSVGVSWGFRSRDSLVLAGADVVIDTPCELIKLI